MVLNTSNESFYGLSDGSTVHVLPSWLRGVIITYVSVIATAGAYMNARIAWALYKKRIMRRRALNPLVMNLCVVNMLCAIASGCFILPMNILERIFEEAWCMAYVLIYGTLGVACECTIVALSVAQFVVVCKSQGTTLKHSHLLMGISVVWIWSIVWNIVLVTCNGYGTDNIQSSCGIVWNEIDKYIVQYSLYMVCCFFIPMLIMGYCYVNILITVKKSTLAKQDNKTLRHTTKVIFRILAAFMICWSPYGVVAMIRMIKPNLEIPPYVESAPSFLAKLSYVLCPIVYTAMNKGNESLYSVLCWGKSQRGHAGLPNTKKESSTPCLENQLQRASVKRNGVDITDASSPH